MHSPCETPTVPSLLFVSLPSPACLPFPPFLLPPSLSLFLSLPPSVSAAAGGEYQVVLALISAADVATAAASDIPLSAVPKLSLPFGHPPSGCPGIDVVAAGQLKARGLGQASKVLARAPLHPAPGIWSRFTCR